MYMKKLALRLIALCLVLMLLLSACGNVIPGTPSEPTNATIQTDPTVQTNPTVQTDPTVQTNPTDPTEPEEEVVAFKDMEYSRQDVEQMKTAQQVVLAGVESKDDVVTLMDKVFAFYELYHNYYTGYALANIHYSKDLTDSYWEEEYNFFMDTSAEVDAMLDQMLYGLAEYPQVEELEAEDYFGEDFFEDYQGESLWDETFTALMDKESELQAKYYEISGEAVDVTPGSKEYYDNYGIRMAEVYVEMIKVRQEIATYAGYEDYPSFAYDFYFDRDYTPQQAESLMADIKTYLAPLYVSFDTRSIQEIYWEMTAEDQTFLYTKTCAQRIGGALQDAFKVMEKAGLYDISYSTKKYDASFEMFISNYNVPYVFVNPTRYARDKLTFAHEFGHFANDYASGGTSVGIDVAEFFSQGLEYLSLDYATSGKELVKLKMFDSLCVYVEQTMYATFEQRVYSLKGSQLTTENVIALFSQVMEEFGFGKNLDGRMFVQIPHYFISPVYIISYVVSNDAAMQLYQLEQAQKGAGVAVYLENLDTMEGKFLAFVELAGLESPFVEGRIAKVAQTFKDATK